MRRASLYLCHTQPPALIPVVCLVVVLLLRWRRLLPLLALGRRWWSRIAKGHADALLPLLSHALFFFSRHLAQYLADKGYNAAAKNDVRMVEVRCSSPRPRHCCACMPAAGTATSPGRAAGSVQDAARRLRVPAYYQGAPRPGLKQTAHARCSRPLNRRAPRLQVSQFFGGGFAQVKVSFVCDVIRLCKSKHQTLWKQQKDARIKVETNGYRPNARLQAKKPPAPAAAVPKKPSPKRR